MLLTGLYVIAMLIAFPLYFNIAEKYSVVDVPNERSSHDYITVLGSGIILIISCIFFVLEDFGLIYLASATLLASVVGYVDDRLKLRASIRALLYSISILLAFQHIGLFESYEWWLILCFFIVALGTVNAYNFMDGINGITGLYSTVLVMTGFAVDQYLFRTSWFADTLPFVFIFLLFFGFYNYRTRAKTFLGDAGSIALGLFVVCMVVSLIKATGDYGFITFVAVYGTDSVGTIILRIIRREKIFEPHRSHLYQDMTNIVGHSHLKVAAAYASAQLLINLIWIINFNYTFLPSGILAIAIFIPCISFYLWYKYKHNQLSFKAQ